MNTHITFFTLFLLQGVLVSHLNAMRPELITKASLLYCQKSGACFFTTEPCPTGPNVVTRGLESQWRMLLRDEHLQSDNILEKFDSLLQRDPSLINTQGVGGVTALHRAAQWGQTDFVRELLKRGANKEITDILGRTPVNVALYSGRHGVVKVLQGGDFSDAGWRALRENTLKIYERSYTKSGAAGIMPFDEHLRKSCKNEKLIAEYFEQKKQQQK